MSVVKAIQCLIQNSRCNSRKTSTGQANATEENLAETRADIMSSQKHADDWDFKSDSTESGDIASDTSECFDEVPGSMCDMSETTESPSLGDNGSNISEQASGFSDGLDSDSPSLTFAKAFRPPPGLELCSDEHASAEKSDIAAPPDLKTIGTRLNVEALPFVPTFHMTAPISTFAPALMLPIATWEDTMAITSVAEETITYGPVTAKSFSDVEQAVEKMTQDEIAKLKALLDSKESVKHNISLNDMIVDEKPNHATPDLKTKLSSKMDLQCNKSSNHKPSRVIKPKGTVQQSQTPTSLGPQVETTLRSNLEELSNLDPARVLMLRKINKLGHHAAAALNDYFSNFGAVDRVMISHSRAKSIYNPSTTRVRVAGLAFVVMSTAEEAQAALDRGKDHSVRGVGICVSAFESNASVEFPGDDHDFNTLD